MDCKLTEEAHSARSSQNQGKRLKEPRRREEKTEINRTMFIDVQVYTITNGQRNSVDHAVNNIPEASRLVAKALKQGKSINIKSRAKDTKKPAP